MSLDHRALNGPLDNHDYFAYVQPSDPSSDGNFPGAGTNWLDTSTATASLAGTAKRRNSANTLWLTIQASASGTAPSNATFITQTPNATLSAEQALSLLATGLMKSTTTTGVVTTVAAPTGAVVGTTDTQTLTNKSIVATQLTGTLQAAQEPAHTGDVTNTAGSLALSIATGAVTTAKIAAGAVTTTELGTDAVTNAKVANAAIGIAELSATGTPDATTFLRGDNTWAAGGGGGSGTVTSIDASGGTTGLTFSGGPVTTSGTLTAAATFFKPSGLTGAVAASRYVGATATGAPVTGTFVVGDYVVTQDGHVFICTVLGTPGTWVDAGTAGSGTVTSVAVSGGTTGLTVSGSPVTTSGTITLAATFLKPSGLTGAVAATRYVGGTTSGAPVAGTFAVGDFIVAQNGAIFVCTGAGTPGTWTSAGGAPSGAAGGDLAGTYPNPTIGTWVFRPETYGAVADGVTNSTTALQNCINAAIAAGGGTVALSNGTYMINNALTINGACTIAGTGVSAINGDMASNLEAINMPVTSPYLSGSVILQTGTGNKNVFTITATGRAVNGMNFGIRFADAIKFTDTGYGVIYQPPITASTFRNLGQSSGFWQNVLCYGHDGDHYAFYFVNPICSTFNHLQAWGGGGLCIGANSNLTFCGNTVSEHCYFAVCVAGVGHGIYLQIAASSLALSFTTMTRPQVNVADTGVATPPTNAQNMIKADTGTQYTYLIAPDWETGSQNSVNSVDFATCPQWTETAGGVNVADGSPGTRTNANLLIGDPAVTYCQFNATGMAMPQLASKPAVNPPASHFDLWLNTSNALRVMNSSGTDAPVKAEPIGTASGDLSGSYPGPTVAKVNGVTISGTPSAGQVIIASSSSTAAWGANTASQWTTAGSDISFATGRVAIGAVTQATGVALNVTAASGTGFEPIMQVLSITRPFPTINVGHDASRCISFVWDEVGGAGYMQTASQAFPVVLDGLTVKFNAQVGGVSTERTVINDVNLTTHTNVVLDTVSTGIKIKEGTNATMGRAVLVGGTVVVNTTKVGANTEIFLTVQIPGGTLGAISVATRVNGTSFTITSLSAIDTSTVAWLLVEPS